MQGKKGIALTADQFSKLKHAAEQLTQALQASDLSCSHALGDM
jgi:Transcriptional Coactivator p15 (PC4)